MLTLLGFLAPKLCMLCGKIRQEIPPFTHVWRLKFTFYGLCTLYLHVRMFVCSFFCRNYLLVLFKSSEICRIFRDLFHVCMQASITLYRALITVLNSRFHISMYEGARGKLWGKIASCFKTSHIWTKFLSHFLMGKNIFFQFLMNGLILVYI